MYLIICSIYDSDSNLFIPAVFQYTEDKNKAIKAVEDGSARNEINKKLNEQYIADIHEYHATPVEQRKPYNEFFKDRNLIDEEMWSYEEIKEFV